MTTDPKVMAEIVRRLSSKRGDTVLAQITPKEAALLKAKGGAGKKDPKTGVMHYWQANDSDKESDSESESGSSSDSSSDSGSSSGSNTDHGTLSGGGIGDGSSNRDSFVDASSEDTGRSLSMPDGGTFTKSPEERSAEAQAARDSYMNDLGVSQGAQSTEGTAETGYSAVKEEKSVWNRLRSAVVGSLETAATVGNLVTGNYLGAAASGVKAYGNFREASSPYKTTVTNPGKPAVSTSGPTATNSPSPKDSTGTRADRDNTVKTGGTTTGSISGATTITGGFTSGPWVKIKPAVDLLTGGTTTGSISGATTITGGFTSWPWVKTKPAVDLFTSAPRSRQGVGSTQLGSGYGLTPTQKRLLGV